MVGVALLGNLSFPLLYSSPSLLYTSQWKSEFRPYGGYVDEINFMIFPEEEGTSPAIVALQNGDIDVYDEHVLDKYLLPLDNDPNIELTFTPSVRYRTLHLNCDRFPTNITAFRRAMAFAFDKYLANMECLGGGVYPHDSYIPQCVTEWEVESEMTDHFYEADFVSGNTTLEKAGFTDLDGDGWREFDVNRNNIWDPKVDLDHDDYEVSTTGSPGFRPVEKALEITGDGLEQMGIRFSDDTYYVIDPPPPFSSYSVIFWPVMVPLVNPPAFFYDLFRTGASLNYQFSNSTIDAVFDQMVEATTLEEVKTYAREVNRLLTFEQPKIVVSNNVNIGAHRTDRFDGWFEFVGLGTTTGGWMKNNNPYCATKVHLKEEEEPWGGTLNYGLSEKIRTLNPYLQETQYEETVFQYIYETLWNIDPNTWDPIPGLAYDWDIEQTTAGTNGWVQDGQKFTFYLYENETWHDGEPFTAADVKHSIHIWRNIPEHSSQSTPQRPELRNVYNITIPNDYTIELYVNKTGYFEWADSTRFYITPEHIWRDVTDVSAFEPTDAQIIGTGPYMWNEYVPGEYISLLRHEDWRWVARNDTENSTSGFTPIILLLSLTVLLFSIRRRK